MKLRRLTPLLLILLILVVAVNMLPEEDDPSNPPQETPPTDKPQEEPEPPPNRHNLIPTDVPKQTPETDRHPPVLHSFLWEDPEPLPGPVNTAGAEDSPFMAPGGDRFYFFFTPDVRVPAEKQILDEVTGIWVSEITGEEWSEPTRVVLIEEGLSLDGCPYASPEELWFCSVRAGNLREIDFWIATASGEGYAVRNAGEELNLDVGVGELHVSGDGDTIYYHSEAEGGKGGVDIWVTEKTGEGWSTPVNVEAVNSEHSEGYPYLSPDGEELWINRWHGGTPAVFRSVTEDGEWTTPRLVVETFAGEPNLDKAGNLYFVHHYYRDDTMIEADIYLAKRKPAVTPRDSAQVPDRGFIMGLLPTPAQNMSFDDAYAMAASTGELAPIWGRPTPFYQMPAELEGTWGETFIDGFTRGNGMAPLLHFSFIDAGVTLKTHPLIVGSTLSNTEWRLAYKRAVVESVEAARPRFLSVGNEVNRWYEKYGAEGPDGFSHWVSLYEEIYDEVKELSPETTVFCTFSREVVSEFREADLTVLDMFDPGKLDMLVFTSYPHSLKGVNAPDDLPPDYYKVAADRMPGKPFGFSEVAWPSMEAFGGEEAQAEFIRILPDMTTEQGVELRLVMWPWLHDLNAEDTIGLRSFDGVEKVGYTAWLSLAQK